MGRGRILPLPSDKYKIKEAKAEAKGFSIGFTEGFSIGFAKGYAIGKAEAEAEIKRDIQTIGPLLKDQKDDLSIIAITGWTAEKVAKYRSLLRALL